MVVITRRRTRTALLLLGLLVLGAVVDAVHLARLERENAAIVSGHLPPESPDARPEMRFAHAAAQAASGADEAALNRYATLQDDSALGQAARFNSANLLMRQAIAVRAGTQPGKAIALIELAKQNYREVLRVDSNHWDARYNLERAQRLLPDPDESDAEPPPEAQRNAERAATTMRGFSPGLP